MSAGVILRKSRIERSGPGFAPDSLRQRRHRVIVDQCARGDIHSITASLDYFVGKLLKLQRHVETKLFGRLQIDDDFEFGRMLYR
jgi:hypothetical protein